MVSGAVFCSDAVYVVREELLAFWGVVSSLLLPLVGEGAVRGSVCRTIRIGSATGINTGDIFGSAGFCVVYTTEDGS